MRTKAPISYFGTDAGVAQDLAALLDECRHVTIPFCGGMSILPFLLARAIVANDKHGELINFYRVLKSERRAELIARCQATLSHPEELSESLRVMNDVNNDAVARAWAFWASSWIGRKGKAGTKHHGGMPSVRRTAAGGTNASRMRAAAADLDEWARHFQRCEFECRDFLDVLRSCADVASCGIYCDPPWFSAGRNYLHMFDTVAHYDLSMALRGFSRSTVVVRYDDCAQVRRLYDHDHWTIIEAASRTQANKRIAEVWITNKQSGS